MQKVNQIERPATLNGLAYKEIKNLLVTGQLKFNTLYSANQFAEILGVSRTPVREALLQLTNEGCLISVQGQGFKIKEYSEKEIKDFFETRKMIESYVVERLCRSLPGPDMKQPGESLKLMVERAKGKGDTYGFLEADEDFHLNLVRQYNNFLLVSYIQNIRDLISLFGGKALVYKERFEEVIHEHNLILEALKEKNEKKAIESVAYHLDMTERYLLESSNK